MRLVDTHAHLHDNDFARDVTEVIDRAASAGVAWILTLGVNARNSRDAVALAERDARVFAAAGVHPHDARDATDRDLDDLEGLASHARVVAIGEIGLDFYRNLSPRDQQLRVNR